METYDDFCRAEDVHHFHCPDGCEHPQPFVSDGRLLCGRCWFVVGVVTECVPCDDDVCG